MKKWLLLVPVFVVVNSYGVSSQAEDLTPAIAELQPQIEAPRPGMEGNISLDLKNIDIVEALKFLAMKAGVNIVTTNQVKGRVTLRVENTPIKDIFDVMLRANGLAYELKGTIYNVMTEEEYNALYGKNFADIRQVKIFKLDYAIPEQIFNLCDTLKSAVGRVLVNTESGTVVVMDSPEKIKQIEEAIKSFEKETVLKVFAINYAGAKDIAEQLKTQLEAKKVGFVKADERTNQVIVQTLPERMKQIEALIRDLDKKTKEVLIDTKIIKVKFTDNLTESVEWEGLFNLGISHGLTYLGSYPFSSVQSSSDAWRSRNVVWEGGLTADGTTVEGVGNVGSYPFSGTTTNIFGGTKKVGTEEMHIGYVGKHDFDFLLNYFQELGETQIISTPKVIVVNNQEARVHVGEKQAYVTSTTTTGQTTSTVSEEVTFVDVGTQLYVTPTINEEGYVTLKLKTEISSVVDVLVTPTENRIPIIDTSVAETTLMTKDGTTVVIGGLRNEERGKQVTKIPVLSSLPLLGKMFTSSNPTRTRTELLILITPTLVEGDVMVGIEGGEKRGKLIKPLKEYKEAPPQGRIPSGISSREVSLQK